MMEEANTLYSHLQSIRFLYKKQDKLRKLG